MKREDLLESLQYIDDDLLEQSDKAIKKKTKIIDYKAWASVVAVLIVAVGAVIGIKNNFMITSGKDGAVINSNTEQSVNATKPSDYNDKNSNSKGEDDNDSSSEGLGQNNLPSISKKDEVIDGDIDKKEPLKGEKDKEIKELNQFDKLPEDTDLDFWVTKSLEDVDLSEYTELDGLYGGKMYLGKGYEPVKMDSGMEMEPEQCVIYVATAYPDYSDEGNYITQIQITDPKVRVFGLTVADDNDTFYKKLTSLGYEIEPVGDTGKYYVAKKGDLSISYGGGKMSIKVLVTNEKGIVY